MKLWGGRFKKGPDSLLKKFTYSISFDSRLALYDLRGTVAWARMLAKAGIIRKKEGAGILRALERIKRDIREHKINFGDAEDIHTAIEEKLEKLVGEAAMKLRAGRSRNDQVVTDLRMFLKDEIKELGGLIKDLQKSILAVSGKNLDVIMPGFTHLQPAQPVLFSHHLMAYHSMLQRDGERMEDCFKRMDTLPLGSAALAGTSLPVDRKFLAKELGFSSVSDNSIDAVSDRDFIFEFLSDAAILIIHLSRMAEELILWSSPGFGFVHIDESFCTGSSLMPQKKNPDALELTRAKTGRVLGHLTGLGIVLKGLPLAYNRDLQEDKEGLFDTIDTLHDVLHILPKILESLSVDKDNMREYAGHGYLNATDCAEYLVRKGVPFRKAHGIVGKTVLYCIEHGKKLGDLSMDEWKSFSDAFDKDVYRHISLRACIESKKGPGCTSTARVKEEIKRKKKR